MEVKAMPNRNLHVRDEKLLLFAAGDLAAETNVAIQKHLEICALCRTRIKELREAEIRLGKLNSETWDQPFPPIDGARALLKARMARLEKEQRVRVWTDGWSLFGNTQTAVLTGVAVLACLLVAVKMRVPADEARLTFTEIKRGEEPDLQLTPGATVPITRDEVCSSTAAATASEIPISLKQKVLKRYGVSQAQSDGYELDYLITPELGGATDIRNLWPEPYHNVWNAHVKDQLEDRLHRMVCRGDVDLATAQHDIATDWIAAYHKYFHAESPLSEGSTQNLSRSGLFQPNT
jgi:hypothetical protein